MKAVVLGGGVAGLAAASKLQDKATTTLLEKDTQLGGLARSFHQNGYKLPVFYHHIFAHDDYTRRYLRLLDVEKTIKWKRIKVGIVADGKIWNFTSPIDLLRFSYLSPLARIRYGWFGLKTLFAFNPAKLDNMLDARTWLLRTAGREVTEKIFVPLYSENKFNTPLEKISAKQLATRLANREVVGIFGYPSIGLDEFISRWDNYLSKKVDIRKSTDVKEIDLVNKTINVNGDQLEFDVLVNTIPIPEFLAITKGLPDTIYDHYSKVKYCPAVEVAFATKNHLSNHYWLNLFRRRFGMLFQHSNLHDKYPFKFHWALKYGGSEKDFPLENEVIFREYLEDIREVFDTSEVLWWRVFKARYAEPIFTPDYATYKPRTRSGVPGLYNAGTATVFPRIRNMDASIQSGERAAEAIIKDYK